jgi:glucose-1-phosphate thymidylyltransferase
MKELAKDRPKHLIEVLGRPFLFYVLKNFMEGGVDEFVLVVGYKKEAMAQFAKEYEKEFKITLVDQFEMFGEDKYGTSVPIEAAEEAVGGEDFLAIYGDNLYSPHDIARAAKKEEYNYISVLEHEEPEKYGVAVVDEDDFLSRIVEKPKEFVSNLINTGLFRFTPEIFEAVREVGPSPRGEYELTDAIQALAEKKRVKVMKLEDYWKDFGKPEDVPKLEDFLRKQGDASENL